MEKEIFKGKIIRLTKESKKVKNKIIEFEKAHLPCSVHIFLITNNGKFRLLREKRWEKNGKISDKVVAGILEKNEAPLNAAKRELLEELGMTAKKWKKFLIAEQRGVINDKRIYYLASDLEEKIPSPEDSEEIVGCVDYKIDELYEKMLKGYFGTSTTAYAIGQLYDKIKKRKIVLKIKE